MTNSLEGLEQKRSQLYQQLQRLGDFRPGMISVNYRKCGKPNCACAQPGHQGHGPQYLWNTTQQGKSRAEILTAGAGSGESGPGIGKLRSFCRSVWGTGGGE